MPSTAELILKLKGSNKQLHGTLKESEGRLRQFGTAAAGLATKAGVGIAAGVATGAAKSVTAFAGFEKQMNEVFTLLPGISGEAMSEMETQTLNLAKEMGVLPTDVVPALYQSLSAGVPPDNVFEFLETATKASIGGATDLETAVDGMTSVMNAFGDTIGSAAEASDIMFTAVRLGKTDFTQLSKSLFQVAPIASGLGVGFDQVAASLAALTGQGVPTSVAATQIRAAFVELSKEGTKASTIFEEMSGQTFQDFIAGGGNVQEAFELMAQAADESGTTVSNLFGSVEAGGAVLALTGESGAAALTNALTEMGESAGATEAAFDQMDQGLARTWDKMKANAEAGLIAIGDKIAPFIEKAVEWFGDVLPGVIDTAKEAFQFLADFFGPLVDTYIGYFRDTLLPWFQDSLVPAIERIIDNIIEFWDRISPAVEEVMGGIVDFISENFIPFMEEVVLPLVEGIIDGIIAAWELLDEPIMTMVEAVIGAVDGIIEALGGVLDFIRGIFTGDWDTAWEGVKQIFTGLWEGLQSWVGGAVKVVTDAIMGVVNGFKSAWNTFWTGIKLALHTWWMNLTTSVARWMRGVKDSIMGKVEVLKQAWNTAWGAVRDFAKGIWEGIKTAAKNALDWIIINVINPLISKVNAAILAVNKLPGPNIATVPYVHSVSAPALIGTRPGTASGGGSLSRYSVGTTVGGMGIRHEGGPVFAGMPYLVKPDEEIFTPSRNGYVTPMDKIGGTTVQVTVMGHVITEQNLVEAVARGLDAMKRRNGRA